MPHQVVRNSSEHITDFDKSKIADSIFNEINYVANTLGLPSQISKSEAHMISTKVEKIINKLNIPMLTGPLIRELASIELLKYDIKRNSKNFYLRRFYTRVGLPLADSIRIEQNNPEFSTENANQAENPETVHKKHGDAASKEKALLILPHSLADAHLKGDLHIHDLEYFTTRPFCMDHDLRFFFYYGLDSDCTGKTNIASAAKHAEVALLHAAKVLGSAQTNFSGGQGYYNFLTFIAPYLKDLPYKKIKQLMQMFIYEISQSMVARGAQVVFSSVQLSPGVPSLWKDIPVVYKGGVWNGENGTELHTYGNFESEVRLAFRAMLEVMLDGDAWGRPFNFPKPEIAIEEEFLVPYNEDVFYNNREQLHQELSNDFHPRHEELRTKNQLEEIPMTYSELYDLVIQLVAKFGTPYFDNMIPEFRNSNKNSIQCYQCCAYSFNTGNEDPQIFQDKLHFRDGAHFSMGGGQVITLNLPRIAYKSTPQSFESIINNTKKLIDQSIEIQIIKKNMLKRHWDQNHLPFASQRMIHTKTKEKSPPEVDFEELVYPIGIVGMNEVCEHHLGKGIETEEGVNFTIRYLNHIKSYIHQKAKEYDIKLVLARTPAEQVAQRFAVSDLKLYRKDSIKVIKGDIDTALKDISTLNNLPVYYTNGTHLPVNTNTSITDRITIESKFFPILDGGNILHIWLGESNPDIKGLKEFIFNIINNTNAGYFALTKDFSICSQCKYTQSGLIEECPQCGSTKMDQYSRITGYIQSVSGWNEAKKNELKNRTKTFM